MFSVTSSSRIDTNSDSILSALQKKSDTHSLSNTTLRKLVKITSTTTELSKYEAREIFLKDLRIGPTKRAAGLVEDLKIMLPRMASPALKQQLEKFIYNCCAVTSDENSVAGLLIHKVVNGESIYPDDISDTDSDSDESTDYDSDSTDSSLSECEPDDGAETGPENEVSDIPSSSKEKGAEDKEIPPARKFYSGYEKNISEELQKIPAMDVSELVELIKMRDETFLQMRDKDTRAYKNSYSDSNLNVERCALRQEVNEYNPVIRNQEFLYEATHGTGIEFKQEHVPPRRGEHCKLVALSLLDAFFAERMGKDNVPLLKEQNYDVSLRQMAKAEGSLQGEILESTTLKKLAEKIGYSVEMVRPESLTAFKECLQNNIKDKGIIIFYALQTDDLYHIYDDRFFKSYEAVEVFEHASVISWYDSEREICTLNYWQEKYPGIPVELLYKSNQSLHETRSTEFYSFSEEERHLNNDYSDPNGKKLYKYRVEHYPQRWSEYYQRRINNRVTLSPAPGTGYKGLVMLIEPDKNHCRWDPQQQYVLHKMNKKRIEWVAKPQSVNLRRD